MSDRVDYRGPPRMMGVLECAKPDLRKVHPRFRAKRDSPAALITILLLSKGTPVIDGT